MRFYAQFDQYGFFESTPISIKQGPDYNLYLPRLYKEITQEEFNNYKIMGIPEEPAFEELDLSYIETQVERQMYFYYYYHTKTIYYLIHNCGCKYSWEDVKAWTCSNMGEEKIKEDMTSKKTNPFFRDTINNQTKLGKQILQQGMYCPFFWSKHPLHNENNIILGRHRLYSLKLLPSELLEGKKFLFIDLTTIYPYRWFSPLEDNLFNYVHTKGLPCYCLSEDRTKIVQTTQTHSFYIWNYLCPFFDTVSSELYPYQQHIIPYSIFNDEKAFEKFINTPFPAQKDLENFIK